MYCQKFLPPVPQYFPLQHSPSLHFHTLITFPHPTLKKEDHGCRKTNKIYYTEELQLQKLFKENSNTVLFSITVERNEESPIIKKEWIKFYCQEKMNALIVLQYYQEIMNYYTVSPCIKKEWSFPIIAKEGMKFLRLSRQKELSPIINKEGIFLNHFFKIWHTDW